jgi:hypothetical protein
MDSSSRSLTSAAALAHAALQLPRNWIWYFLPSVGIQGDVSPSSLVTEDRGLISTKSSRGGGNFLLSFMPGPSISLPDSASLRQRTPVLMAWGSNGESQVRKEKVLSGESLRIVTLTVSGDCAEDSSMATSPRHGGGLRSGEVVEGSNGAQKCDCCYCCPSGHWRVEVVVVTEWKPGGPRNDDGVS